MSPSLWQNNSLGGLKEAKTMNASSYLSGRPRSSLLESFSSSRHFLHQKRQYHQKQGTLVVGRQLQERSTIILSFQHSLPAYYLLAATYQHYYQWYVYIFLLKVFYLLSLQISYFLGLFGTTLFACTFY